MWSKVTLPVTDGFSLLLPSSSSSHLSFHRCQIYILVWRLFLTHSTFFLFCLSHTLPSNKMMQLCLNLCFPRGLSLPPVCHGLCSLACVCMRAKSLQSCLTLCNPMDCSPPGFSVHGISQARILERVAVPSSRGSSWPRNRTRVSFVSCIGRWVLYHWCHLGSLYPVSKLSSSFEKTPYWMPLYQRKVFASHHSSWMGAMNSSSPHPDCGLANWIILLGTLTLAGGSDTETQTQLGSCPQWFQWVKSSKAVQCRGAGWVAMAAAAPRQMILAIPLGDVLLTQLFFFFLLLIFFAWLSRIHIDFVSEPIIFQ